MLRSSNETLREPACSLSKLEFGGAGTTKEPSGALLILRKRFAFNSFKKSAILSAPTFSVG